MDMQALSELIRLVTRKRVKKVELFDENSRNKASNYFKLFDGIHSEKFRSDEEAARDIYGCDPSEKKYLILKTRLKQKLLNTLFFLSFDDEDLPEYKSAIYECNKALYCAKVLLMNGSPRIAIPTVEKTLRRAQEFQLTDIELECAKILRAHYSGSNQYKDFVAYRELADYVENKSRAESQSDRYFEELIATYAKSKSNRPKVRKLAEKYYKALQDDFRSYHSVRLGMNYYRIKTMFHQLSDDYRAALEVNHQAENYVRSAPRLHAPGRLEELAIQHVNFRLHLKDYEGGLAYAKKTVAGFKAGSAGWYSFQENLFLLAMHTANYLKAAEIFQEVVEQTSFRSRSEVEKERWKTFQAYLHYLYKAEKLKPIRPAIQNTKTGFRLGQFLESMPEFAKERRGLNTATLIAQLLFDLEKMNLEGLAIRVEALSRYCRRYPKKDVNFRSECFISMLLHMRDEQFRFYQTRKASEKDYEELQATPLEYRGGNRALEVLPYEVTWNIVMDRLKAYKYG